MDQAYVSSFIYMMSVHRGGRGSWGHGVEGVEGVLEQPLNNVDPLFEWNYCRIEIMINFDVVWSPYSTIIIIFYILIYNLHVHDESLVLVWMIIQK